MKAIAELNRKWIEQDIGRKMTDAEMRLFEIVEKHGMTDELYRLVNSAFNSGVRCERDEIRG